MPITCALFLMAGCATVAQPGQALVPTKFRTQTGPYTVFTNTPLPAEAPELRHLENLERQIEASLGVKVPAGESPIEVYILDDAEAFSHFLKFYFPTLPPRRAFFLAQGERRVVYTAFCKQLDEDLRHEATHALLHVAVADLPLWLDEGLAEYFEGAGEHGGLNAEHLAKMPQDREEGWKPDLRRLESFRDVRQMSPGDYREAWAWVHFLLDGNEADKAVLLQYLTDLRVGPEAEPLSRRLVGDRSVALLAHVEHLSEQHRESTTAVAAEPPRRVARLQNEANDPPPLASKRKGLLARFLGIFGL